CGLPPGLATHRRASASEPYRASARCQIDSCDATLRYPDVGRRRGSAMPSARAAATRAFHASAARRCTWTCRPSGPVICTRSEPDGSVLSWIRPPPGLSTAVGVKPDEPDDPVDPGGGPGVVGGV